MNSSPSSFNMDAIVGPTATSSTTVSNLSGGSLSPIVSSDSSNSTKSLFGSMLSPPTKEKKSGSSLSIPGIVLLINAIAIFAFLMFGWSLIIQYAANKEPGKEKFITTYKSIVLFIDKRTGYPGIGKLKQKTDGITNEKAISLILDSHIPFVFKRDLMEEKIASMSLILLSTSKDLSTIQEEIAKFGFVHPEIMGIFANSTDSVPIISLLRTLETIKFGTSMKIFSLLDTFLLQTSRTLNTSKEQLSDAMTYFAKRGEKDIDRFLTTCYLNPYEVLPDCKQINDFSNYFRYDEKGNTKIDPLLFSKIVMIMDAKLEQSELPSIQVSFDKFSQRLSSLSFDVTVNTLPEDEAAFLAKGIINPHIFIISTLVNFLKQSMVVMGDSINVNKLNIQKKIYSIGDIQIPINTSSMKFNLPLQKPSQREIYDYFNQDSGVTD